MSGQQAADTHRAQAWWARVQPIIAGVKRSVHSLFVLIDANARIGSEVTDQVGPYAAQQQDESGRLLQILARDLQLDVPQTHEGLAAGGPQWTWQPKQGVRHRIDYILVPTCAVVVPHSAGPRDDIDISSGTIDHRLVQLSCRVVVQGTQPLVTRRRPACDRAQLSHPVVHTLLDITMQAMPRFPLGLPGWRPSCIEHVFSQ